MIHKLQQKNKYINLHTALHTSSFESYGRVVHNIDVSTFIEFADMHTQIPAEKNTYVMSYEVLETYANIKEHISYKAHIEDLIFKLDTVTETTKNSMHLNGITSMRLFWQLLILYYFWLIHGRWTNERVLQMLFKGSWYLLEWGWRFSLVPCILPLARPLIRALSPLSYCQKVQ